MDQTHITDDELHTALENYRWALGDAQREAGDDAERDEVIAAARSMLRDDDPEQHDLIVALAESDNGDPVWNLEEELLDD